MIGSTGGGRSPALGMITRGSMCLDWRLRHMVETGRGVFLPVIGVEIGCMTLCIGMDLPTRLPRNIETTVYR